jgi:ferritin-like metal-binding protein YciE
MSLVSMKDLLLLQLKDLYSAETQLVRALPAMIKGSGAPALRRALQLHLRQTEEHVDRLQVICEALDTYPGGHRCRGMEGIIEEARALLRAIGTQSVVDAAIVAVAQRIEQYETAAYTCAKTYATLLGLDTVVNTLAISLEEEEAAGARFAELAEQEVNDRALVGMVEDLSFR